MQPSGRRARSAASLVVVVLIAAAVTVAPASAAPTNPRLPTLVGAPEWHDAGPASAGAARGGRTPDTRVRKGRRLALDRGPLAATLARAPMEGAETRRKQPVLSLPTPEGGVARFAIVESPVVEPGLGHRHPETRTYAGTGLDDPAAIVRLDLGPLGFHAQVRTPEGGWYIDPESRAGATDHLAYRRADLITAAEQWRELAPLAAPNRVVPAARTSPAATVPLARTIGPQLRTYRLALATTGQYSQYHGGTVPLVHNALVAAVNRVNGIFRPELGVRFVLVANNDSLIQLDPVNDPYNNGDGTALLAQNQQYLDAVVGDANYDIGHVFSTGGGGLAGLGVVGLTGQKARGETGSANPTGDAFWVDYVAHELGHQLGAEHTFSGTLGACAEKGAAAAAVEPGSGSTIMGYAAICDDDDLQWRTPPVRSSDPFFHAKSFDQIQATLANPGQGGTVSATGNSTPAATPTGGTAWTIPPRTPFVLSATAADANLLDAVSLQWEQYDSGALRSLTTTPKTTGALFRSFPPTAGRSGSRTFPKMASILANATNANSGSCPALPGGLACWSEFLPTGPRMMNFRVTARDNRPAGGGVANADATVTVAGTSPFRITSQTTPTVVSGGSTLAVKWDVVGTNAAPYNVPTVDIRLTVNGGLTYIPLATATPNDGGQIVAVPRIAAPAARIQVRAVGNIFFDINDANISIRSSPRVAVGNGHSCAVLGDGTAKCWGANFSGELGNGTFDNSPTPVPVSNLTNAVAIAAGDSHTCVLLTNSTVKCWGSNSSGELGNGTTSDSPVPTAVNNLTNVIAIAAGGGFTCALNLSGSVRCWGWNGYGALGNNSNTSSSVPVTVSNVSNAVAIATGGGSACAVLATGPVRCWGANGNGQLGDGTQISRTTPVAVQGITNATAIAAGDVHFCAVLGSGAMKCWGNNGRGQLGDGTESGTPPLQVVSVSGMTNARSAAAAFLSSCALLATGTVACWGYNLAGTLGTGTGTGSLVPVAVSGLTGVVSISAWGSVACAVLLSAAVKCWGDNSLGQIGTGSTTGPDACGAQDPGSITFACARTPTNVIGL